MASRKPAAKAPAKASVPAVLKKPSTALADPTATMSILKAAAERGKIQVAKAPSSTSAALSFRNGVISFGGRELGHEINVVMLAPQFKRAYYARPFDADNPAAPDCYSFDNVGPHEKATDPQAKSCQGCPMNEWKSDQRGKGKACREGLRVAMLHADQIGTTEQVASTQMVQADFSVLNSKDLQSYLDNVYEVYGHPAMVITKLSCNPDPKRQLVNDFEALETIAADGDVAAAIAARIAEAEAMLIQPYPDAPEGSRPPPRPAAKGKGAKVSRF